MKKRNLILSIVLSISMVTSVQGQQMNNRTRMIILMFDGLRPDYITPDLMPNLYAFKMQNSYGAQNHSVYPTVTRVNSASYATGSYPEHHGLMGNTVYFPQVDNLKGLNTGEAKELMRADEATNHNLLTAVSLGEILAQHGEKLMVFSSGSSGQAFLQNHRVANGAIINPELILPESFKNEVTNSIGTPPPYSKPNEGRHKWMMDAFMKYGLPDDGPLVSALWFSDPDGTAHAEGIGSPLAIQALKIVDGQFGRMLDSIKGRGDSFNILISTDHGFVTHKGTETLSTFLINKSLKASNESDDVAIAEGALYVKDHDKEKIKFIVSLLQQQEWVGPIFTRPEKKESLKGWVAGTLSFDAIHWNHRERAADILVDENWSDDTNQYGYKGTSFSRGVAGHGGFSSWEVHIPLIAAGPAFKKGFVSELPSSNVDIVPTVLTILGIKPLATMDGRVLSELFVNNHSKPAEPRKETTTVKTSSYVLTIERSVLGEHKYVNFTKVSRITPIETSKKQNSTVKGL
jgi:predicted AlkP superfamily pyrophosphatase or phosphodiesterase